MAHKLSSYIDGNVRVPFCELCSAEGLQLFNDCPQDKDKKFTDKPVDNHKEPE